MPIKISKPTNNARRQLSFVSFLGLSKTKKCKKLVAGKKRLSGRNKNGQLVISGRGCGAKRLYRFVDFRQNQLMGERAKVKSLEYDPNRSAFISLIEYKNGEVSYILSPEKLKIGSEIECSEKTTIKVGNRLKIKNIPPSMPIFNIELNENGGGKIARSAGSYATILGVDGKYAQIKMPSGEIRKVLSENYATIGMPSNIDNSKQKIGKAGRVRNMGIRPSVRGKAKNPCDHPHGGGEGGSPIGMKYPKTPWGAPALGRRTRNKKNKSSQLILNRRKK